MISATSGDNTAQARLANLTATAVVRALRQGEPRDVCESLLVWAKQSEALNGFLTLTGHSVLFATPMSASASRWHPSTLERHTAKSCGVPYHADG